MAVNFVSTEGWSREEWLSYRHRGIGASEIGTILGVNKYQSSLELFHLKIGRLKQRPMSLRMNLGHMSEPLIAELWEYWDRDKIKFNNNVTNRIKVRRCEDVKGYMYNDKYPNLFVSLDRRFKDDRYEGWCNLELKNKTSLSYKQFTDKMNPVEVCQLAQQNLISEYQYSEIAYFIDNVEMEVLPMSYKDSLSMESVIVKSANKFWNNVEQARVYINQIENAKNNYNNKLVSELEYEILQLEPPPDNTEAYFDYLTDIAKTKQQTISIKGDELMLEKAKKLLKLRDKKKKIEEEEIELKSQLATSMHQTGKYEIEFGKNGKVSFYNGRFSNKVK